MPHPSRWRDSQYFLTNPRLAHRLIAGSSLTTGDLSIAISRGTGMV